MTSVQNVSFLQLRIGDEWNFQITIDPAFGSNYTNASLIIRTAWGETAPILLSVDQTSGLTVATPGALVTASIPGPVTKAIVGIAAPQQVACLLRMFDPATNATPQSAAIPLQLLPDLFP